MGNPYKYGGTSLTNGADCSGFTQSIYKEFGYDIPRTSLEQSAYGTKVSASSIKQGDLVFYQSGEKQLVMLHCI
ncbi:MAG: C40 family peptidase [Butyribacter sp.]